MEIYSVKWRREYSVKSYDDYDSEPGLSEDEDKTLEGGLKFSNFEKAKEYAYQCVDALTSLFEIEKKNRENQNIDCKQEAKYHINNYLDNPKQNRFYALIQVYMSTGGNNYSAYADHSIKYSVDIITEYIED